jgi:hypothetical protein
MNAAQTTDDNRQSRRFESAATLTYFPFTSRKVSSITVQVQNCSPDGLSFQSPKPLKPGQTICLHTRPVPEQALLQGEAGALLKSFALAEVRWCVAGVGEGYSVGVKYV